MFELLILLSPPHKCWHYSCVPSYLQYPHGESISAVRCSHSQLLRWGPSLIPTRCIFSKTKTHTPWHFCFSRSLEPPHCKPLLCGRKNLSHQSLRKYLCRINRLHSSGEDFSLQPFWSETDIQQTANTLYSLLNLSMCFFPMQHHYNQDINDTIALKFPHTLLLSLLPCCLSHPAATDLLSEATDDIHILDSYIKQYMWNHTIFYVGYFSTVALRCRCFIAEYSVSIWVISVWDSYNKITESTWSGHFITLG